MQRHACPVVPPAFTGAGPQGLPKYHATLTAVNIWTRASRVDHAAEVNQECVGQKGSVLPISRFADHAAESTGKQEHVGQPELPRMGSILPIVLYKLDVTQYDLPAPRQWVKLRNVGAVMQRGQLLVRTSTRSPSQTRLVKQGHVWT